ncbi:hypothetical protein EPNKCIFM_00043 [Klebsiella phage KP13-16]|nr:hypothetical protein EPNKCIFM_00043 [Klebsiella phage KP13-16]
MAKPKIMKRGRGRPARQDRLLYELQTSVLEGQEKLAENYMKAVNYLVAVLDDEKASVTNKISSAKTIKEAVESVLAEMEQEDDELPSGVEETKVEEEEDTGPIFKIE